MIGGDTSLQVRRARGGDAQSASWVVERFTPALLAQARYRLGRLASPPCEPEDLVDDVWAVALGRLPEIGPDERRATPVLVAFLATTLLHLHNNLLRKMIRRRAETGARGRGETSDDDDRPSRLPDATAGVVTRAVRRETSGILAAEVLGLPEPDRDIVVLRALEQVPTREVASRLGLTEKAVSLRYNRALAKLRAALPESILREIDPDPEVQDP